VRRSVWIRRAAFAVSGLLVVGAGRPSAQSPRLDPILAAAGTYLTQYASDIDGVVIEEDYFQQAQVQAVTATRLRSDLAMLSDPAFGWIEFRDTAEVDGKPVADRQTRAVELFSHPSAAAIDQARRVVKEGARFNLAAVGFALDRTINLPLVALRFLRAENQSRSAFARDGSENVGGQRTAIVTFKERGQPRMIGSTDNAAASGQFWIEPESGQVRRTELVFESHRGTAVVAARIGVEYREVPALRAWLPRNMDEEYRITNAATRQLIGVITGRAIYSNYRKFNVSVEETPSTP
jgi:hypothetical protein